MLILSPRASCRFVPHVCSPKTLYKFNVKVGNVTEGKSDLILPHTESQNKTDHFRGGGLWAGQSL